jgi:hypothetical protein
LPGRCSLAFGRANSTWAVKDYSSTSISDEASSTHRKNALHPRGFGGDLDLRLNVTRRYPKRQLRQ